MNSLFNPDWTSVPIAISDGGNRFFQVWFDLDSHTIGDLHVHGEA